MGYIYSLYGYIMGYRLYLKILSLCLDSLISFYTFYLYNCIHILTLWYNDNNYLYLCCWIFMIQQYYIRGWYMFTVIHYSLVEIRWLHEQIRCIIWRVIMNGLYNDSTLLQYLGIHSHGVPQGLVGLLHGKSEANWLT